MYRLLPTVMPNVAAFCDWCGKCYDLIALETLVENLVATAYDGETVRDRGVRSRAFIDGFEAALFSYKRCGTVAASWLLWTCCARVKNENDWCSPKRQTCLNETLQTVWTPFLCFNICSNCEFMSCTHLILYFSLVNV